MRRSRIGGSAIGDGLPASLLALAMEKTELRQHLADAQDLLMETTIDAGHLHARIQAVQDERDIWRTEAERLRTRVPRAS